MGGCVDGATRVHFLNNIILKYMFYDLNS